MLKFGLSSITLSRKPKLLIFCWVVKMILMSKRSSADLERPEHSLLITSDYYLILSYMEQ